LLHLVFEPQPPPRHPDREVCVWRDEQGRVFARAFAQGARRWIDWPGLGIFAFTAGSHRVQVWPATTDRDLVAGAFARRLQPIILQALGRQAIHASAVLGRGGVLAFCGVGHSGKSTLAFAMTRIGYRQVADDALVLERLESTVSARLLPFRPGLREPSRRHFGSLTAASESSALADATLPASAPLRGIVVLQQDSSLRSPDGPNPVPPVQAFAALVTHARCFDEADAAHTRALVDDYLAIAEVVPVYSLRYPAQFGQLSSLLMHVSHLAGTLGVAPLDMARPLAAIP
jgi:hypothetical protein